MIVPLLFLAMIGMQAQAAASAQSEQVLLTRRADGETMWLLGFAAFGSDPDLRRLEAAAQALGAPSTRIHDDPQGRLEVMVLFPQTPREVALQLYHGALNGRYGRLAIEAAVMRRSDAADGIDTRREVRMVDPAMFAEDRP